VTQGENQVLYDVSVSQRLDVLSAGPSARSSLASVADAVSVRRLVRRCSRRCPRSSHSHRSPSRRWNLVSEN